MMSGAKGLREAAADSICLSLPPGVVGEVAGANLKAQVLTRIGSARQFQARTDNPNVTSSLRLKIEGQLTNYSTVMAIKNGAGLDMLET